MSCERVGGTSGGAYVEGGGDVNHDARRCVAREPPALMPSPFDDLAGSSDLGGQIAALLVKASREQRSVAHEARGAAEKAQLDADQKELDEMKEQADHKLTGALISAGTQIAAGAASMNSKYGQAGSQMTQGTGKAASALYDHEADMDGRAAKEASQSSGRAKTAIDDARDMDKDAKEMLNRALSYYKEYLTAKSDTMRATLLRA